MLAANVNMNAFYAFCICIFFNRIRTDFKQNEILKIKLNINSASENVIYAINR